MIWLYMGSVCFYMCWICFTLFLVFYVFLGACHMVLWVSRWFECVFTCCSYVFRPQRSRTRGHTWIQRHVPALRPDPCLHLGPNINTTRRIIITRSTQQDNNKNNNNNNKKKNKNNNNRNTFPCLRIGPNRNTTRSRTQTNNTKRKKQIKSYLSSSLLFVYFNSYICYCNFGLMRSIRRSTYTT